MVEMAGRTREIQQEMGTVMQVRVSPQSRYTPDPEIKIEIDGSYNDEHKVLTIDITVYENGGYIGVSSFDVDMKKIVLDILEDWGK